jgi:hypothetical protein
VSIFSCAEGFDGLLERDRRGGVLDVLELLLEAQVLQESYEDFDLGWVG